MSVYQEREWVSHLLALANTSSDTLTSRSVLAGVDIAEPIVAPLPKARKSTGVSSDAFSLTQPRVPEAGIELALNA